MKNLRAIGMQVDILEICANKLLLERLMMDDVLDPRMNRSAYGLGIEPGVLTYCRMSPSLLSRQCYNRLV